MGQWGSAEGGRGKGSRPCLRPGECQGPRVHPCWPWRSSLSGCAVSWALVPPALPGWAAKTSATLPKAHGSPLCQGGSAVTLPGGACPHPRACSGQHLELLREQRRAAAVPETRPMWSTAPPTASPLLLAPQDVATAQRSAPPQ